MRERTAVVAAMAAGALVWAASSELPWPARLFSAILLGPAPILFMLQARAAESLPRPLPRIPVYAGSIGALWVLGLLAYAAGMASGFTHRTMGFVSLPALTFAGWTLYGIAAAAIIVAAFRAAGMRETEVMGEITPVTASEKAWFCALSVSAGACEEAAFRGFLIPALSVAAGSIVGGVALSSLAFGVLHAHQRAGAVRAAVIGAVLALPLIITGSVYPSMAAHALVDVVGGLWLARWLLR
ncbi:MAG: lysostaphin resistance A-like protein [Gemmatimonadota bacterium]